MDALAICYKTDSRVNRATTPATSLFLCAISTKTPSRLALQKRPRNTAIVFGGMTTCAWVTFMYVHSSRLLFVLEKFKHAVAVFGRRDTQGELEGAVEGVSANETALRGDGVDVLMRMFNDESCTVFSP